MRPSECVPSPRTHGSSHRTAPRPAARALAAAITAIAVLSTWAASNNLGFPAQRLPEPEQHLVHQTEPWTMGAYTVTPLATYRVEAVVLSKRAYRADREAEASPLDLALGWGAMADASVLSSYRISQRDRWYFVRWARSPLGVDDIVRSSANTHIVPATPSLRAELEAVAPGDVVRLQGYLVELSGDDGWRWRSSLSRDDTGAGACEVLWVESVEVVSVPTSLAAR